MANKLNFTGWSGKTDFLSGGTLDILNLNVEGRTQSSPQANSKITTGPVVVNKNRPKSSQITPGVKQSPVARVKSEPNPDFSKATKLGRPSTLSSTPNLQSTSTPFTAGTIDTSFPNGFNTAFNADVYVSKVQSDGKILVGGNFDNYEYNGNSYYAPQLIRLNADGSPDFDFAYTLLADEEGWNLNNDVRTIDIQSDGKILIGGDFDYYYENSTWYSPGIMRFNSDGTFDNTLLVGDGFNSTVRKIIVQPNGKILVAGDFDSYNNSEYNPNNGPSYWRIIRLQSNGNPDLSFNIGYGFDYDDGGSVYDMILQPDGKIICGGDFYYFDTDNANNIIRLNSDGSRDNTFVIGNGFNYPVYALALQSDGKVIVGGDFDYYNNIDLYNGYIVRLGVNGEMDTRFGYGLDNTVSSLYVQSDDKILVGGGMIYYYPDNNNTIDFEFFGRFHSDCTLDYSFVFQNLLNNGVTTISLDSDNKIYIGGNFTESSPEYLLNRFGKINNSISEYPYTYTVVACAQPLESETIIYMVGSMTELNPFVTYSLQSIQNPSITVCGYLVDIYPSNVIEYTVVNTYADCEEAYTSNYKIVLFQDCLGDFTEVPVWVVDNRFEIGDIFYADLVLQQMGIGFFKFAATIVDVLPWSAGTSSFGDVWYYLPPTNYVTYSSCDEAIEANGLIYVAINCITEDALFPLIHQSYFQNTSLLIPTTGNPVNVLVEYLPYGFYEIISGGTPEIYSTVEFTGSEIYNSLCEEGLSKISPEGVLNPFFDNTGFAGSFVYTTVEQPDGKILVGGDFTEYLEVSVGNFMRINPDGSLDETFYLGGFNSGVKAITLQPDGKILVGGNFTDYDGYNVGRFIRLNSDGTNDESFTYTTEFDGTVNAIAVQRDGKIVVGGDFSYYYDFYCPQIVRLNSDGSPDFTFVMGDGFDGGTVYTINIETIRNNPFYVTNGPVTYTENIIVGGQFTYYKNTNNIGGIVKLSPTGDILPDFGNGFNQNTGGTPRVNNIVQQPDGKLIVVGGGYGNDILDYNETFIPKNIVRLVKDDNGIYQIDDTFTTHNWDGDFYSGGFGGAAFALTVLPNGKIMVGGFFSYYGDNNNEHNSISHLVRLNSDGTLDTTFTFELSAVVYTSKLLSSGILIVGGRFSSPMDRMLELFIGEDYELRSFTTCDGTTSNIFLPTSYEQEFIGGGLSYTTELPYSPISTDGLDIVTQDSGGDDDSDFLVELPFDFDVNFLGVNYTSVWIGTNSYLTFGDGSTDYGIDPLPGDIPAETGLPGVYISTREDDGTCLDSSLVTLYTGTTDGGNTTIIRFEGNNNNSTDFPDEVTLIYNFKFYKDQSNYFDLIIEQNNVFCNDDPTGGISNGVDPTWVTSFDTSSEKSYRIYQSSPKPIKANVNERVAVCGTVGSVITTPNLNEGSSTNGSMYFDGVTSLVTIDYNEQMDLNYGPWTVEWYQKYTSTDTCCRRIFDIGQWSDEQFGVSIEDNNTLRVWLAGEMNLVNLNTSVYNVWTYFAITSENTGGENQILRMYQDGVLIWSASTTVDLNNFFPDSGSPLPLVIGGGSSGDNSLFQGYITNFRWSKGTLYYNGPTMEVPTSPLVPYNSQLLFLTPNEAGLLTNECEVYNNPNHIPANQISGYHVTWSSETPFVNLNDFSLFTATNSTSYNSCSDCGQLLKTILYVRDGANPNYVLHTTMTPNSINNVLTNGPIFTLRGPECYEILKYTY